MHPLPAAAAAVAAVVAPPAAPAATRRRPAIPTRAPQAAAGLDIDVDLLEAADGLLHGVRCMAYVPARSCWMANLHNVVSKVMPRERLHACLVMDDAGTNRRVTQNGCMSAMNMVCILSA